MRTRVRNDNGNDLLTLIGLLSCVTMTMTFRHIQAFFLVRTRVRNDNGNDLLTLIGLLSCVTMAMTF